MSQIGTLEALIGRKSAILDVDWSRIGTLETLIGSRAVCEVRHCPSLKVCHGEWMVNYEYWFCQVNPFHLKLTQINSERNCIAKHKSPDSQERNTRRRGENFKACQEQRHVYLIFVQEKIQKIFMFTLASCFKFSFPLIAL